MEKRQQSSLEQKLDKLIELCFQLRQENSQLREREGELLRERSALIEKNEVARNKVELMINRLKGLTSD